jgi:hypothetical protein
VETAVETSVKMVMELGVEVVVPAKREGTSGKKGRPTPPVPRIPVPRVALTCAGILALRQVLHGIAEGIHTLRVSNIVTGL